ncbi:GAF and ANTAR domain-containing protein [Nocardia sp. NPDC051321]|uniref:GAF and ANTAR domain-containing protein n=1 Tax=Nocardia sp. NPDC051321 TaxID=3364323 RepID=UPI0037A80959
MGAGSDEPVAEFPGQHSGTAGGFLTGVRDICASVVRLTNVDGAAVAVFRGTSADRELVYATDAVARDIDELQFVVGEGPCLEAYRHNRRQIWGDLQISDARTRWPAFTAEALTLGARAAFAFPITAATRPIGVLELYRASVGPLTEDAQEAAAACAVAVGRMVYLSEKRRGRSPRRGENDFGTDAFDHHSPPLPFSRAAVYVAADLAAVQLAVSVAEALDRLRAYAYANGRSIIDVAADILTHRLSLRNQRDRKNF